MAHGRVADLQGKLPEVIAAYREAVAIQDALPYMEPPYWYYPVRQSLGMAQLRAGQLDQAEQVFRTSLARAPSDGWAPASALRTPGWASRRGRPCRRSSVPPTRTI